MKLLSFAVPCYNSAAYMRRCIDSILCGGEDVEIIIIDDGSTNDDTAQIADEYEEKYPTIVKAVHKENGGHGSAVNMGIKNATGLFFKVVDSDDWVRESSLKRILDFLRETVSNGDTLDMLVSNYVYNKDGEKRKKVMHHRHTLPVGEFFTWSDCHHFRKGHYILMHSVIFRTKLLKDCGLELPEHTFYVDNLYVFEPLLFVKRMYYLDENFYQYYIGRGDQSVNEKVMISRLDQQIRVNKIMIDYMADHFDEIYRNRKLFQYMRNYLEIITTVSMILLIKSGEYADLERKEELLTYLKNRNRKLFRYIRYGLLGEVMNLPGKGGRKISVEGYRLAQKIFQFN